jgi:hypothetical protein
MKYECKIIYHVRKSLCTGRNAKGEWVRPNLRRMDGVKRVQRGWESEIGGSRPRIEMVGSNFMSRSRTCMGCSAWE